MPTLTRVNSLDYSCCAPWEWMHLFLENVVPTLVKLWTGQFKGIDEGEGEYCIVAHIWEEIGEETAASTATIPAMFVRKLPNIADGSANMTAEAWGFWFIAVQASEVLQSCLLVADLMRLSIKLEITQTEVEKLRDGLIKWVMLYENLQSHQHPWSNLANRVLHFTYLTQVGLKFDLMEELDGFRMRRGDELLRHEHEHKTYTDQILRSPCQRNYQPDEDLR
ncbi:hypothetical protein EV363DRAFT_1299723 [Boletus edulis]|nr:hypothetical protein EV363DRAFT_1299723 [Boletus edulis]